MLNKLQQTLLALEEKLLDPAVRGDRAQVAAMLLPEFREVGRSGRSYSREEILDLLANKSAQSVQIERFTDLSLGSKAALATYNSVHGSSRAHRASVWLRREGRWLLLYHQGTPSA